MLCHQEASAFTIVLEKIPATLGKVNLEKLVVVKSWFTLICLVSLMTLVLVFFAVVRAYKKQ
jgi:hypothetical protein